MSFELPIVNWFRSVVVITFALHAKGHGFEPRRNLIFRITLSEGMAKLTKNRMSITSLDRISPMFFDGPYDGTVPVSSDGIIYNERCVDPDIEHVASGAYRERCVDPELEDNYYQVGNNRFSKRRVSRSRKTSKQMKKESPYRASTSSSDLERAMVSLIRTKN